MSRMCSNLEEDFSMLRLHSAADGIYEHRKKPSQLKQHPQQPVVIHIFVYFVHILKDNLSDTHFLGLVTDTKKSHN